MRTLAAVVIGGFLLFLEAGAQPNEIETYPGAEIVEKEEATQTAAHLVVLGALEKINHELVPEKSEVINGVKSSTTWYLPQARRTRDVARFYEERLQSQGEIVFQCVGRSCGSSSYWANRIFDRAILYGPEQYQFFYALELSKGRGFLSVYVGQRATRKIYVHMEQILKQ
ncbi:MAG: DUF4892 domain-containing protein [Gammaproteobacteria bacterium]|jgi:hypothetical protein|nr:DUF4892 domain-containing protein [Gammaproteobacteria bacterium]MBT4493011.1 DUF4892 domain-containing protein [Gammaproteobacteria bacterium]MBT7371508.1 DUF4892 domain-containing protein [Gammaproteobacteria bacterium]